MALTVPFCVLLAVLLGLCLRSPSVEGTVWLDEGRRGAGGERGGEEEGEDHQTSSSGVQE